MIPRKNLIPLKKELARIRKEGRVYDSSSFGLVIVNKRTEGLGLGPRCAFIVSKKVERKSVGRHEIKRKLSGAVSPLLPRLPKNVELVFLAKQKAMATGREELGKEVEEVLRRGQLL